jgi:heme exporter protein CcmD
MNHLPMFLTMHGYGAYVWSAYALSVAILFGVTLVNQRKSRNLQQKLKRFFKQ